MGKSYFLHIENIRLIAIKSSHSLNLTYVFFLKSVIIKIFIPIPILLFYDELKLQDIK